MVKADENGDILVILTGGTIASASNGIITDANTKETKEAFLNSIKEIVPADVYERLRIVDLFNVDSKDLNPHNFSIIAKTLNEEYDNGELSGAMVIGGTNTAKYSIPFLELMTDEGVDATYVCAMRTPEEKDSDGKDNFETALCAILNGESKGRGIMLSANRYELLSAFDCIKNHPTAPLEEHVLNAFVAPINVRPMITTDKARATFISSYEPWRPPQAKFPLTDETIKALSLVKTHIHDLYSNQTACCDFMSKAFLGSGLDTFIVIADKGRFLTKSEAALLKTLKEDGINVVLSDVSIKDEPFYPEHEGLVNAGDLGIKMTELTSDKVWALSMISKVEAEKECLSEDRGTHLGDRIPETPISSMPFDKQKLMKLAKKAKMSTKHYTALNQ